ncbi:hypothetical protein [Paludisphaera mucosa]|uniref:Glycoside hydrolase family 42 N-terminal domain-containing protein n=1 Tax=Paludisphaera mucosa TaxID=3030827 RepID=A0ABT6F6F5_9BACT|nr:hypothetical protein [Paludisphaera mucosa]MDG3003107.1 hypothetical protein [Paludisphaera mucosa]
MRRRGREVLAILAVSAMGTLFLPAPRAAARGGEESTPRSGLSIELTWSVPGAADQAPALEPPPQEVVLELTDGRATEAVAWPWDADTSMRGQADPAPTPSGAWRLGSQPSGRVRMRIEATPASTLLVRRGDQVVKLPVSAILEGPQTVPQPSGLSLTVQRLPWDVLAIDFGAGAEEGVAAPGTAVPVTIGYNILQADAGEVTVRTTAVLRPIGKPDPVWQFEQREVLPANLPEPPARLWSVPAPAKEGSYILEVQATWESAGAREGSRIGRLIRRRRAAGVVSTASRRVVLAVLASQTKAVPAVLAASGAPGRPNEVDSFELSRLRSARFAAWGRSPVASGGSVWEVPAEVLVESSRRDREREWLRGFITKPGAEPAKLGPVDASGLAWTAVALRSPHPDRPHRLTVTIAGGDPSALGALVVDAGSADRRPRVLLDACGTATVAESPTGTRQPLEWIVWPGTAEPILVLFNRNPTFDVTVGAIRLIELEPTAAVAATPPVAAASGREVGIQLVGSDALERFEGSTEPGMEDAFATAENLASYLGACGSTFVILPERLEDRSRRRRLNGRLAEDATGPDRLDMVLRVLRRRGMSAWLEPDFRRHDAFPELPPPDSAEALQQGLARIGPTGAADGGAYQPLHPRVHAALERRIVESLADRNGRPGFAGVLVRLGCGPTLLGTPDTGMDDETFARFVRESFGPDAAKEIPGLGTTEADRFAVRSRYLAGIGRMPWLTWRAKAVAGLYGELAAAARKAAPGGVLVLATPTLDDGPTDAEARRVDLAGLAPSQAWRSLGLDLEEWPKRPEAPLLLRGAKSSDDGLARDLASHPDLDAQLVGFSRRGFLLHTAQDADPDGRRSRPVARALPPGESSGADGLLAHAVSALDAQRIVVPITAVAGREERVRRFAEVYRRIPMVARPTPPSAGVKDSGVVVRTLADGGRTVLEIVNDTPFAMRLAGVVKGDPNAAVEDLGRNLKLAPQAADGGRRLVVDLAPYGVSVVRVGAADVVLEKQAIYPPEPVLAAMESRSLELSSQLALLNRGLAQPIVEPPNAGFEQEPVTPVSTTAGDPQASAPGGWRLDPAGRGATVALDQKNPHAGQRCLKLESLQGPASLISGDFAPGAGATLLVQAFLRADKDQAPVRVWIEGEQEGRPFARRSDAVVATEWRALVVRASDLPPGGLDSVRLRFESTVPGRLWIDDVRVRGEIAPKAVRLNAQRTLLAALQAYREQRYAEFARLADSHWTRHPGVLALVRSDRTAPASESRPAAAQAAEASALPPDRTLR